MDALPFVDEHRVAIAAPPAAVWAALLAVLRGSFGGAERVARLLGCEPAAGTPALTGRAGETLPGFRVAQAEPERRLVLEGRHRFARYALTFRLEDGALAARTDAAFPGLRGGLYRLAVIGSGGHRVVTRRLLRAVRRRAERG